MVHNYNSIIININPLIIANNDILESAVQWFYLWIAVKSLKRLLYYIMRLGLWIVFLMFSDLDLISVYRCGDSTIIRPIIIN